MRILGITLPDEKRMEIALTAIYGIGRPRAKMILMKAGVDGGKKAKELSPDEENKIRTVIEQGGFKIEGDLKREVGGNIKRLKDIKAYRGVRHLRRLPTKGQRTKTNARTLKGVKKTMGSGRRKTEKT
ncbi:30S ribosomal protein S13 [Candidatus Parcubacteria bacterium]|nr:30S ribosomal protein S13 [Candidatus Parcubacteria bacterium]